MKQPEPIVLDNFQKGIGDSPHVGFEDIRNLNIISSPGSVSLNFATTALAQPPTVTAVAYTVVTATNVFTVSSTSGWYNSMAVTLNTVVTSTGISTGRVYWVGDISGNTFKLYSNPTLKTSQLVDVTGSDGSGTISSYTISAPLDKTIDYAPGIANVPASIFILDDSGRVWWVKNYENAVGSLTSNLVYLGNDTLTSTGNRAIVAWKNYLVVFRSGNIDYLPLIAFVNSVDFDSGTGWVYGWESASAGLSATRRPVLVGQDDVLYYQNGDNRIGSLVETANDTFDPTDTVSYTKSTTALDLPEGDDVTALGELGSNLLIGTKRNKIYPWDRTSTSFSLPITVPENVISHIVTINNGAYIFAGYTGRIYWTNGSSVSLYKTIPNQIAGVFEPYYTWGDVLVWRNQLYFSFSATGNDGSTLTSCRGVWAIDAATRALRQTHSTSTTADVTVLLPHVLATTPTGNALYVGWTTGSVFGVDISTGTYHTSYSAYFVSPLFQVGTSLNRRTIGTAQIVFEKALASGEGIKLYYRKDRSQSWSTAVTFDFATYGAVADGQITFPASDLTTIQFKVELTGSTTTPSLRTIIFT